jgi:hypothetical protein
MGKFISNFDTIAELEAFMQTAEFKKPHVSLTKDSGEVHYFELHDYSQDYFTMVVTVGGDIKFSGSTTANTLSYSKDNGENWTAVTSADTISVAEGDKVLWKCEGTPTPQTNKGIGKFSGATDVRYSVEGNAMSLLFGDDFKGQTSLEGKNYALYGLFSGNTNVTSAENMSLPATTLAQGCYQNMFNRCTSITTAPELPATTLANYCYQNMFLNCTSITTAPELPATTLANNCYTNMLQGCTSITTAPELPATTVASSCYSGMFSKCTSLTTAPELPATTLADFCYNNMFSNCTSLTTAPELPATTVAETCCQQMFSNCTSLTTAPSVLPATTLAQSCYYYMFQGCTSLTTAPELPATTLAYRCYQYMFQGCTSLSSIKCLATNISANSCTSNWVNGVPTGTGRGTFTKAASMTSWTRGNNGIPSGWSVQDAA